MNDAPALVESDLGVAIGAGTDVAIEAADIVLVSNNPEDVAAILGLSRKTYGKMVQNLIWATGYNAFAIPLAAGVAAYWGLLLTPASGGRIDVGEHRDRGDQCQVAGTGRHRGRQPATLTRHQGVRCGYLWLAVPRFTGPGGALTRGSAL